MRSILGCSRLALVACCAVIPWAGFGNAAEPKNTDTISFDYRGTSSINYSIAFKAGKTDFYWGTFELSGSHFHSIYYHLGRNNPINLNEFELSRIEKIDVEGGVLEQNASTNVMIESVDSIDNAIDLSMTLGKPRSKFFTFKKDEPGDLGWQRAADYSFLGYVEGGRLVDLRAATGTDKPLIVNNQNIEFEVDHVSGFITKVTTTIPSQPKPPAPQPELNLDTGEMETPRRASQFLGGRTVCTVTPVVSGRLTMTYNTYGRYNDDNRENVGIDICEVSNLTNDVSWPFYFESPPEEGEEISLLDNQQIKAIWQKGKIVRAFDGGVAEELASARFRKSPGRFFPLTLGFFALIAIAWGLYRIKKGKQ